METCLHFVRATSGPVLDVVSKRVDLWLQTCGGGVYLLQTHSLNSGERPMIYYHIRKRLIGLCTPTESKSESEKYKLQTRKIKESTTNIEEKFRSCFRFRSPEWALKHWIDSHCWTHVVIVFSLNAIQCIDSNHRGTKDPLWHWRTYHT